MAPNMARGETSLELGGVAYTLRPTFDANKRIEKLAGCSMFALVRKLSNALEAEKLSTSELVGILEIGLFAGPDASRLPKDLGEALHQLGLANVFTHVCALCTAAIGVVDGAVKP